MKTRAAVIREPGQDWEVIELDLDEPKANEIMIRYVASGLCHSDEHLRHGDIPGRYPMVGGHEGSGVVEQVGPGVTRLKPGDHVVTSFLPACGHCRWCSTGQQNLCDLGINITTGEMEDGTFRWHAEGEDFGGMCMIGTFSQYATISQHSAIKVDEDLPLEVACLVGCGVPTGWGSSVYAAETTPGDTIVIYGIGGVGINAVQGAAHAGAKNVIAVDPHANKREMAEQMGATHSVGNAEEAMELSMQLTNGVMADKAVITVDIVNDELVQNAFDTIRKGGRMVLVGLSEVETKTLNLSGAMLTLFQKDVIGRLFGGGNPFYEIPKLLDLYRAGTLKLDELVTKNYSLDELNQGYQDLADGKNVRGVLIHQH